MADPGGIPLYHNLHDDANPDSINNHDLDFPNNVDPILDDSPPFPPQISWPAESNNPEPVNDSVPRTISVSTEPPIPYICTSCDVLRQIVHTNGNLTTRLEIHGRIGMIYHGILENNSGENVEAMVREYEMINFCRRSLDDVKKFLLQYFEQRKQAGYLLLQDPLSVFYDALCVGPPFNGSLDIDDMFDLFEDVGSGPLLAEPCSEMQTEAGPSGPGPSPPPPPGTSNSGPPPEFFDLGPSSSGPSGDVSQVDTVSPNHADLGNYQSGNQSDGRFSQGKRSTNSSRSFLSLQRERSIKMTLKSIEEYFHLPIEEAARKLEICPTVIKKVCRKGGIKRWPYRKIKSILSKIEKWKSSMSIYNDEEKVYAQAEISRLEQELVAAYCGKNV